MQALYVLVLIATSALGAGSAEAQRQLWLHKPEIADLSTAFEGSEQGHSAAGASLGLTGISSNQAEQQPINSLESVQAATAATGSAGNWRGVRHRAFGQARKLLTGFSSTVIQVAYSNTTARCPSSTDDWAEIPGFGHLVSDNWVCSNPAPPAQVHGASSQDYVTRPGLETYSWAAFTTPAAPAGTPHSKARLQGLNLHVIGSRGLGAVGTCSLDAVDIAIYGDISGAPSGAEKYSAKLVLGITPGSTTFTWGSNTSTVISFDIVDASAPSPWVELDFNAKYWLRVKLLVPYLGTDKARCFASWALNNVSKTGSNCLWQETNGGAAGYSTSCTGAKTNALPGATQTFYSCFNGGTPGAVGIRRCQTFRLMAGAPITCPAQFLDFNFAFYGHNAANCSAAPSLTMSNGTWPSSCANTQVGQSCAANCTWGGNSTVECLYTGEWSNTPTGACADPPTNCSSVPSATLSNGTWPGGCAQKLIGENCTATCTWGGDAQVTCQYGGTWDSTITGSCNDPPTNCSSVPSATLSNGTWPANCAEKLIGEVCNATCTFGGTANVTCQAGGTWDSSSTGTCNDPYCADAPTIPLGGGGGSWDPTCDNSAVNTQCTATCTNADSNTRTATCQSNGTWTQDDPWMDCPA